MKIRPEVNLIVGACTSKVNAVQYRDGSTSTETLLSEKPMASRILPLDI